MLEIRTNQNPDKTTKLIVCIVLLFTMNIGELFAQNQNMFNIVHSYGCSGEQNRFRIMSNETKKVSIEKCSPIMMLHEDISEDTKSNMVSELLSYRRIDKMTDCFVGPFNPLVSQIFMGNNKNIYIKMEALYLIHQILLENAVKKYPFCLIIDEEDNPISLAELNYIYSWYIRQFQIGGIDRLRTFIENEELICNWYGS